MAADPNIIQNAIKWDHPSACHATIIDADQGLIDWKGRTKLAICGFASSSRDLLPVNDPEWVIWGLNQLNRHIDRGDAWIDIHHDFAAPDKVVEGTDFAAWLKTAQIPVFMAKREPDIPMSVRYPIEAIVEKYGVDYFTSTISYMIAYGIWAGFKTIGIWGVDLIVGKEYFYQKPCAEFWIGVGSGAGVDFKIPDASALLRSKYRYGYQDEPDSLIRLSEMNDRVAKMDKRKDELLKELQTVDGARQDAMYWLELMTLRERGGSIPAQ